MGSVEKRVEALERLYGQSESEPERVSEERKAEIRETMRRACEKADAELEAGDPRRHYAIESLKESIIRRASGSRR